MTELSVGGLTVEDTQAKAWATEYLLDTRSASSYPAYDAYEGSGDRPDLGEADLLAPALLNVAQKPVKTYYSLQTLAPILNVGLALVPVGVPLDQADDSVLEAVAALFGVLDEDPAPAYVGMTKLAKVLARKRPGLIPVYDEAIGHAYSGCPGAPVPWDKSRPWSGYAAAWLRAMRADLVAHHSVWTELAAIAPGPEITPLRALDIVAWRAGQAALPPRRKGRRAAAVDPL
ncbi:DUF6308 family protein [Sinomonas soli]